MFLQIHNRITVQITTWIFIALVSIVVSVLIVASNAVTIIMLGSVLAILAVFRTLPNYIANLSLIFFSLGTIFISLTTFRVGGEFFNASDLLYLISAVLLVVWLVILKVDFYAVFIKGNPFLAPLVIFVIGGLLSMFNSADTGFNAAALGKFIFLFAVWLPVAIYLHDSETKIKLLLIILAVATLLPVISCLSDYFLHTSITSYLNNMLKLNLELPDKIYLARFGSVMGHPNNFASLIVVVFPISLWLVLFTKSLFFKLCSVGFLVGIVLSIVITGSRACFVAIIVEVVVLYGLLLKKRWISFIVILMLAIIITINIQYISDIFPQSPIKRLSTMMSMDIGDYRADVNRVSSMKKAVSFIIEYPIAGIGVGHVAKMSDQLYVHNTLFRFWAAVGVFGLVSCLWFYGKPLYLGFIKMRSSFSDDFEQKRMMVIILSSIVGSVVFDMAGPQFHSRFKWICVAALFSMWNIQTRK